MSERLDPEERLPLKDADRQREIAELEAMADATAASASLPADNLGPKPPDDVLIAAEQMETRDAHPSFEPTQVDDLAEKRTLIRRGLDALYDRGRKRRVADARQFADEAFGDENKKTHG